MKQNNETRIRDWTRALLSCAIGASWLAALPVHAHISMKGALQSRGGDQKSVPCDGPRGTTVYTFAPGATITLAVNEDIPHPSYFRISFDNDGQDFEDPISIKPVDPTRACPFNADDQCGKPDYCSTARADKGVTVLWDDLDPHLQAMAKGGSWNFKLPDIECDNCTLQVIQVMEDTVHGAYCPTDSCKNAAASLEDVYHRCIDIKLVKGTSATAPGTATGAIMNNGMDCSSGNAGSAGAGGSAAGSGAAASGSGGSPGSSSAAGSSGNGTSTGGTLASAGTSAPPTGGTAATMPSSAGTTGTTSGTTSNATTGTGTAGTGTTSPPTMSVTAGRSATNTATSPSKSSGSCSVAMLSSAPAPRGLIGSLVLVLGVALARRRSASKAKRCVSAA
jgi:hypothetical protein